jgi:Zn-dependent protease with chaperone function
MIFLIIENFVFFGAILAVIAYSAAEIVRFGIRKNFWQISPFAQTRIYASLILLPPILSLWLVLAALLPETWLATEVFKAAHISNHEWHLLSDLTAPLEPFLAAATIIFLATILCFAVWKAFRGFAKINRVVRLLEIESSVPNPEKIALVEQIAEKHHLEVGLVMSNQPLTFVWGFWRSKLILSSGLLNTLNESELRGVIEHEAAHHLRSDNLVKLCLSVAAYLSPVFPLTQRILRTHLEQIELVCDEIAAAQTKKPLEIASALVKVRRNFPRLENKPSFSSGFMSEETPSIEQRVKHLVNLADELPTAERRTKLAGKPLFEAFSLTLLFLGSLIAILSLSPLLVHQTTETVIGFIK